MKRIVLFFAGIAALVLISELAASGQENVTYNADSTRFAYTLEGDLYVCDLASGKDIRITSDGGGAVMNGYASWVYYEEIFGRASLYRAFWWSPDGDKLAWYRFDESRVPVFPIYSPFGQDGKLRNTRYPKAGEPNPEVRIGMVDLSSARISKGLVKKGIVWAQLDSQGGERYFGIPFWGADSKRLFVPAEPRIQRDLDLYSVDSRSGAATPIYHEHYATWIDWPEDMLFSEDGLYMTRAFESGWEQIYFLSYDGARFEPLTSGPNWRVRLLRVASDGSIFFTAQRDSHVRSMLYRVVPGGAIERLTPIDYNVDAVEVEPDGSFSATLSNGRTPRFEYSGGDYIPPQSPDSLALPQIITIPAEDGQLMYGSITYPKGFDPSRKYPVHMEIYGGPNTAYVTDRWRAPSQWWSEQGIIQLVADARVAGHTGRKGTDLDYKNLTGAAVVDFVAWAEWLKSQPYVGEIGVEGFSFGGTNTAMLLLEHSDLFRCGIAGGGVYDWMLYDSHYTERFMSTPEDNPEGYANTVLSHVGAYPGDGTVMLRLTHGTGDDNVHFQNTLQLVDALQKAGKQFELMIYPDGMHGYRGAQRAHSVEADRLFWQRWLLGNNCKTNK